ncbi:MAG: DUF134 domain-containing protein [Thermoplasmata archaeon]
MSRPKRCRRVCCDIGCRFFKPRGIPLCDLKITNLGIDELESLRLSDQLALPQMEAAKRMRISQPTFNRILSSARRKVADCLVEGKAIKIEGE